MSELGNPNLSKEEYKAGDYIFFEGDIDFHFYIIESGEVQIFTKAPDGKRINLLSLKDGESFGEFAFLSRQARSASAQAITACNLIKVTEQGFEQLLSELPVWASSMLKSFAHRLKQTTHLVQVEHQFTNYKKK